MQLPPINRHENAAPWIIAELELVRARNAAGENPNLKRPIIYYDYDTDRLRISKVMP